MPQQIIARNGMNFQQVEFDVPALQETDVRMQVDFAAPKHGTETKIMTDAPFVRKRWDPERRLFLPRTEADPAPAPGDRTVGNMVVGTVVETGSAVTRFAAGDRVFGYGPVAEIHQAAESRWFPLGDLSPVDAVCVDPAHVAFGAVRDGNVRLGDDVAVFGLGAIGILTVNAARAAGARRIIAVDPLADRRACALSHGADLALDPTDVDAGWAIKEATDSLGVDVAIETSGSDRALHQAVRCLRQCGTVVHVPFGPNGAPNLRMDEEFHHNRVTIVGSQISNYWRNPSRDHPLWDADRAFLSTIDLFRRGLLKGEGIVTPIVPFTDAVQALTEAFHHPERGIKVGVEFGERQE